MARDMSNAPTPRLWDPVALPLGPEPLPANANVGLYGAFRDAAPDYWGRLIIAAEKKVPPEALTEIDFLLFANATRVGNLDFRKTPESPEPALEPPHFNRLADLLTAASQIESGAEVSEHLLRLLRQGSSVGGARPKCTVEWGRTFLSPCPSENRAGKRPLKTP